MGSRKDARFRMSFRNTMEQRINDALLGHYPPIQLRAFFRFVGILTNSSVPAALIHHRTTEEIIGVV